MKIKEIQEAVKATSSERQIAARKELAQLWKGIKAAFAAGELAAIRPEVVEEFANGTGYMDGALNLIAPMGALYGGRDKWGRFVIVFEQDSRTQCLFERHSDDDGNVLISQRGTLVNEYAAERMLLLLRQAVEGLFQQEKAVAAALSGDGYFDLQFRQERGRRAA